ncbi:MAG TPA: Wzz/FepE/Etk N-terminal domain-containing protein, partial [Acidobacteriota bacterium]|nr:Wzz/FepE/Etk N-terminal domain-containing protein [Acidobacteriota bacterium]
MEKTPEYYEDEIDLMEYLEVLWKRKWLIIIPTFILVVLAAVYSLILPEKWKVEAILEPSKFFIQTEQGNFQEVLVSDPKQLAGEINNDTYDALLAAELNIDIKEFPEIEAENMRDTNLLLISIISQEIDLSKSILLSLFEHMKRDLDKKIDVEMSSINTSIQVQENLIKQKNLNIEDIKSEVKLLRIEKNKLHEEILSLKNRLQISKERADSLMEEMKSVKARIDKIEEQQRAALSEKQNEMNTLSLLLYSNEVQHNLRYYNTLDESLSNEKLTQENLDFQIKGRKDDIKMLDTEIEKKKTQIDGINNDIENIKNQIKLL